MPLEALDAPQRLADASSASGLFAPLAEAAGEVMAFAYLDAEQHILGLRHARGSIDRLALPIRTIAADALAFDAAGVVMAHNHPSGDPAPSATDIDSTRSLLQVARPIGLAVRDHLIFGGGTFVSFREQGLL